MRIGVDLGGTKIEGVLISDVGEVEDKIRRDTPADNYDNTLDALCSLIEELQTFDKTPLSVGIGTPGTLSMPGGIMKNCNSVCLRSSTKEGPRTTPRLRNPPGERCQLFRPVRSSLRRRQRLKYCIWRHHRHRHRWWHRYQQEITYRAEPHRRRVGTQFRACYSARAVRCRSQLLLRAA